tara:strand:- start:388 stop:2361 length:1974 start_codon:yes stop_codon:yes gene_type:complete
MKLKNILKRSLYTGGAIGFSIILLNSLVNLYESRTKIKDLISIKFKSVSENIFDKVGHDEHGPRYLVNPLEMSRRQVPPDDISDLKILDDANINGQWSAPIDWNVTAIHSVLLPNEKIMTFGSFGILSKEDKDVRSNKKITITDGRTLERDRGLYQWSGHDVNSGIDFDIWDIKKGFGESAHKFYNQPIVMDSFCTVVRVLDKENVFFVGGNLNKFTNQPDTQNATMIYNIKDGTFKQGKNLKYKRWYGSAVRTGDEKLLIIGGKDVQENGEVSHIPEIIDLNNIKEGWKVLEKAGSQKLFGEDLYDEWSYPKSFLTSDGNVVGISYNKIWVMNKDDDFRVNQTGEIPIAKGGIARHLEHVNPNLETDFIKNKNKKVNNKDHQHHNHANDSVMNNKMRLRLVTMGGAVGSTSSAVMKGKDNIYLFGGKQYGDEYTSSNKVYKINFTNSSRPEVKELSSMAFPRSNANATILPNGDIFINGGEAYNDNEFSIFTPEIYNVDTETTKILSDGYFRRNYHSTSILLPDGRILVSGGDVWNSEIFYPPYLFEKDWEDNTILAKRPKIINFKDEISRGKLIIELEENQANNIDMISILSTGSTTHAQGSEQKFRSLDYKKISKNKFEIIIPNNPNELANGTYMIFAVTSKGVPSVGKIFYLN